MQQPSWRHSYACLQSWSLSQLRCLKTQFLNEKTQTCQCTHQIIFRASFVNFVTKGHHLMRKVFQSWKNWFHRNDQSVEVILTNPTNSPKLLLDLMMNLSTPRNPPHTQKVQTISQPIDNTLNRARIFKCLQAYLPKKLAASMLMKISFISVLLAKFNAFAPNASFMVFVNLFRKT